MGKEEKRILALDQYEHGVVINALNDMRNDLMDIYAKVKYNKPSELAPVVNSAFIREVGA